MIMSWQALQNNGKHFKLGFELLAENWKIFKQIAMCENWSKFNVLYIYILYIYIYIYISMDSSWQALQINGKFFFSNVEIIDYSIKK